MNRRKMAFSLAALGAVVVIFGVVSIVWRSAGYDSSLARAVPDANLVLITLDTTRADHLGAFGGGSDVTPSLDGLAARGVAFVQAQSPAPITLVAHTSILSGLYPFHHGVRNNGTFTLPDSVPTLATLLQAEGYRTGAFVSAYVLARRYGLDRGFDIYDDDLSRGRQQYANVVPARRAEITVDAATSWIESLDRSSPFFCWLHLYDPHAPYDPPGDFRRRFPSDPYTGEIAYMDSEIGRFFDRLDSLELVGNTFIAALGDHGEALGEHGEQTHAILLHQATTRVPWILAGPGLPAGVRIATPVSTVDFLPTLCRLLGVTPPRSTTFDGTSLIDLLRGQGAALADRWIYFETMLPRFQYGWSVLRGMRRNGWEMISGIHQTLYDLDADPRELVDLFDRERSTADVLERELERIEVLDGDLDNAAAGVHISESEREKLAALGYVGFSEGERTEPPDPRDLIGGHVHMERARAFAGRGMSDEALSEIDAMVAQDPQNVSALTLRAGVLITLGRVDEAAEVYQRVLGLDPEDSQTYRSLAQLELGRGDAEAALELARIGSEKRGAFGTLTATEATALIALGRVEEAVKLLDARLGEHPDDPELLTSRASIYLAVGAFDEGETLLRRAVAADALHHRSRLTLAAVLERNGRTDEAIGLLEDLLKIDPGHAEALARIGVIKLGDPGAARAYLEEAVRLQPRRADYLLQLGVCYLRLGDHRRAEASLRRGLELQPDDPDLLNNLSIVLTLDQRYGEAEPILRDLLNADPAFAEARNNLALCLLYQGRLSEAESEARRVLATGPAFRDARLTLSAVLFESGRFEESAAILESLLAREPHDVELSARLGMAVEAGGDAARALPLLRAAFPSYPQHLELLAALARAEERAGDREEARRLYASLAQASSPGGLRDQATDALERLALDTGEDPDR
jgi:choline-sulfatase